MCVVSFQPFAVALAQTAIDSNSLCEVKNKTRVNIFDVEDRFPEPLLIFFKAIVEIAPDLSFH